MKNLVDLEAISSLLVCPRCRRGLVATGSGYECNHSECALSSASFQNVGRWPVLIDFEASVINPDRLVAESSRFPHGNSKRWSIERLPRWLRPLWKPRNRVAERNVRSLLALLPPADSIVLVIGGGTMGNGVEALYDNPSVGIVAFDITRSPLTQFVADAHRIPLADESVDAVLIQAVLEHVVEPAVVVEEIHRVLKPDGVVYSETAFQQPVHAGPYDFVRYTASGHRFLFRFFEELRSGPVAGPGTQLLWSLDHFARGLTRSELSGKLVRAALFWLRLFDHLIAPRYAMDNASSYFFLGRKSSHSLPVREIIGYYRGAQTIRESEASP